MIDIKGLDKAEVLKALYDNSHVKGMGFLQAVPAGTVTVDHCRELLKQSTYFDYLYGRVLKVDLSGDKFDEPLVEEGKWPEIGATNHKVLNYCKREQEKGARIILWTNRADEPLDNAIKWCEEHGLRLDAVNDNLQESVDFFGSNTRKIYADEFIDDRMKEGFNLPYTEG